MLSLTERDTAPARVGKHTTVLAKSLYVGRKTTCRLSTVSAFTRRENHAKRVGVTETSLSTRPQTPVLCTELDTALAVCAATVGVKTAVQRAVQASA